MPVLKRLSCLLEKKVGRNLAPRQPLLRLPEPRDEVIRELNAYPISTEIPERDLQRVDRQPDEFTDYKPAALRLALDRAGFQFSDGPFAGESLIAEWARWVLRGAKPDVARILVEHDHLLDRITGAGLIPAAMQRIPEPLRNIYLQVRDPRGLIYLVSNDLDLDVNGVSPFAQLNPEQLSRCSVVFVWIEDGDLPDFLGFQVGFAIGQGYPVFLAWRNNLELIDSGGGYEWHEFCFRLGAFPEPEEALKEAVRIASQNRMASEIRTVRAIHHPTPKAAPLEPEAPGPNAASEPGDSANLEPAAETTSIAGTDQPSPGSPVEPIKRKRSRTKVKVRKLGRGDR